jgi:DNA-binding transcriptional regulator YhcF (GntR family)
LPDQLAQKIGKLIDQGLLKAGHRLPSIRAAAIEYGVAKNTVVEAYERLVALGYVRAQQGSGFLIWVAQRSWTVACRILSAVDMIGSCANNWSSIMLCV